MKRIVIFGASGSGKSTLAVALGARLHLPVTHLDTLYWQPGWKHHADLQAFRARMNAVAEGERWIIEGNYIEDGTEARLRRADTCILLAFPTWLCLWRANARVLSDFGKARPDLAKGCKEQIDPGLWHYIWTFNRRRLPSRERDIAEHFRGQPVRLHRPRDVHAFLDTIPKATGPHQ